MSLTTFPEIEQGSEQWHDLRRGLVTASVVGRLVTAKTLKPASNDESRRLTEQLVAERICGWTDPTYVNADMWRGIEHEPHARDHYSGNYQQAVEVGFMLREEEGWRLGYSPDGVVGDDGLIEIKAPRAKTHVSTILADEVPACYMPQLQAGLLVSGRKWIDFVSFCGGLPLYVKRVLPDPRWFEAITAACIQFETTAAEMVAAYEQRTQGMPATERVPTDLGLVF
jgi:putative phage-type endonuclease